MKFNEILKNEDLLIGKHAPSNQTWILSDGDKSNAFVKGISDEALGEVAIKEGKDNINYKDIILEVQDHSNIIGLTSNHNSLFTPTPSLYCLDKVDEYGNNLGKWHVIALSQPKDLVEKQIIDFTILSSIKTS